MSVGGTVLTLLSATLLTAGLTPERSLIIMGEPFPPADLSSVAWIALVPFLYLTSRTKPSQSFRQGLFLGFLFYFGTQYWIYHSINNYGGLPLASSLAVVMLLCLYEALYTALFGWVVNHLNRITSLPMAVYAPSLWMVLEYLRGVLFTGFPWSLLGYTQTDNLTVIQIADLTGVYGVSFLVVLVNSTLTDIIIERKRIISVILTVTLLAGSIIYGHHKLQYLKGLKPEKTMRLGVIQGNIDQSIKWDSRYREEVLNKYKRMSSEALIYGVDLIIWPETALPFYFDYERPYTDDLKAFVQENSMVLLTGTPMVKERIPSGEGSYQYRISNSAVLILGDGKVGGVYDKIHLVPFGEYVPLKSIFFFVDKLVEGIGDFQRGENLTLFRIKGKEGYTSFFTLICYEAIFPSLVRRFPQADFMVNITNDAWFGRTAGPYQHFEISRVRAVENRMPLVRAANTGISAIVDMSGQVLERTDLFRDDKIITELRISKVESLYRRFGDIFVYLNFVYIGILWIMSQKVTLKQ